MQRSTLLAVVGIGLGMCVVTGVFVRFIRVTMKSREASLEGKRLADTGDKAGAEAAFRLAVERALEVPGNRAIEGEPRIALARLYEAQGRLAEAEAEYEAARRCYDDVTLGGQVAADDCRAALARLRLAREGAAASGRGPSPLASTPTATPAPGPSAPR